MQQEDFFSLYLKYVAETEPPIFFQRWCAITSLGAFLSRQIHFRHGHFIVNPNIYTVLVGVPGTRKTTAIKLIQKLIKKAGYTNFAADKTSKEKLLLDIIEDQEDLYAAGGTNGHNILEQNLWGDSIAEDNTSITTDCFIMADELLNFLGSGNIDFLSLLGVLWDYEGTYKNRIKNGKSVAIPNPTISVLGGVTPVNFSLVFPHEAIGQGFFSRTLFVYSEPSERKVTFPPDIGSVELIEMLQKIKKEVRGEIQISQTAKNLLDKIYKTWISLDDVRFEHYSNRRFTQLIKLCLNITASRLSTQLIEQDIIYANTILTFTEYLMPKALGEFGKAKHSDISHRIMQLLDKADTPVTMKEIWKHVHNDLEKMHDLAELIRNLLAADKIQSVQLPNNGGGFLSKKIILSETVDSAIDYSLLTNEERMLVNELT